MTDYDGLIEEEQDKMKVEIDRRAQTTENTVLRILSKIVKKDKRTLTLADKVFLKARASYLTDGQREYYAEIIAADYSGSTDVRTLPNVPTELEDLTNEELRDRLKALGMTEDEMKKLTNKAKLIEALKLQQIKKDTK